MNVKSNQCYFITKHFAIVILISIQILSICFFVHYAWASYADWMSEHKEQLKGMPINQVTLLGSHDSTSCDIHVGSPAVSGYLTHRGKHKKGHASKKDVRSAVCQGASIKAQLEYGVRHIDLRIAYQDGRYWGSHMYISTPAFGPEGVFTQIKEFLKKHPDEVIIMTGEHLYSETAPMTTDEAHAFYNKLETEFRSLLIKRNDFSQLTFGEIWKGEGRVILVADITDDPFLWDVHMTDSTWMNERDPGDLISELKTVVDKWRNGESSDKLRRLQAMTTTGNKLKTAKATNALVRKMIRTDWKDAPISVLQVDDAVKSGLMPLLIKKVERLSAQ